MALTYKKVGDYYGTPKVRTRWWFAQLERLFGHRLLAWKWRRISARYPPSPDAR